MIYGVVAQERINASAPDALAVLDFVNGVYTVNGSSVAASTVVDDTGRISGSGLSVIGGDPAAFIGDVGDMLLTGDWSISAEVDLADSTNIDFEAVSIYAGDFSTYIIVKLNNVFGSGTEVYLQIDHWDGSTFLSCTSDEFAPAGVNTIAATVTDTMRSVSLNGNVVSVPFGTDSTLSPIADFSSPPTQALVYSGDAMSLARGYLRRLSIYPPVSNDVLPTL